MLTRSVSTVQENKGRKGGKAKLILALIDIAADLELHRSPPAVVKYHSELTVYNRIQRSDKGNIGFRHGLDNDPLDVRNGDHLRIGVPPDAIDRVQCTGSHRTSIPRYRCYL